ncbi:MAG: PrsW family glutamic-type intramembrane protease [Kineosporiaceae bacterium]
MLVFTMVLAACWGVVQLAALGSASRTVRLTTLLLAVGVGAYGCGLLSVALEFAITRVWAASGPLTTTEAVRLASYTVNPFVEEIVKVLPLVAAATWVRTRRQWGLTDHVLVGAAIGAGFGLLEAVLRFGDDADRAIATGGGWLLAISLSPPFVPGPALSLTSWLPAPVSGEMFTLGGDTTTNQHLAWSAVAGLGVGVLARVRSRWRLLGLLPVLLVGADHAANNYGAVHALGPGGTLAGDVVTAPFRWAQPVLWLWPLLALAVAVALDIRRAAGARRVHPDLLLAGESPTVLGEWSATLRYAALRPPWPGMVAWRFVLARRAALNGVIDLSGGVGGPGGERPRDVEAGLAAVARIRRDLDLARSPDAWQGVGLRRATARSIAGGAPAVLRRHWPVIVWLVLLLPALLYYGFGTSPPLAGVQGVLVMPWAGPGLLVLGVAGLVWTAWQTALSLGALPAAGRHLVAETAVRVALRAGIGAGALVLGVIVAAAVVGGTAADRPVLRHYHVLEAVSDLLLIGGLALLLAAVVFFPPFAAVAVAGGGVVLVPALSTSFVALGTLGLSGVLLSQAADGASASGRRSSPGSAPGRGDPIPDIPQVPPRPKPRVRHWKLRNIVDNLWHHSDRPDRIGDGTTMDALRNEIRTGRSTQRSWHERKAEEALTALTRWWERHRVSASRPDRETAWALIQELRALLRGPS